MAKHFGALLIPAWCQQGDALERFQNARMQTGQTWTFRLGWAYCVTWDPMCMSDSAPSCSCYMDPEVLPQQCQTAPYICDFSLDSGMDTLMAGAWAPRCHVRQLGMSIPKRSCLTWLLF